MKITVTLIVDINEQGWQLLHGGGDNLPRSVTYYVLEEIAMSQAAEDGSIREVTLP
jgi:hypothetical protein